MKGVNEIARYVRVERDYVRRLIRDGKLYVLRVGEKGTYLTTRALVHECFERLIRNSNS